MGQELSPASVVAVAFPIAVPGLYDYRLPERLIGKIMPGTPVMVELRSRRLWGVVIEVKSTSSFASLKEVLVAQSERWTDASQSLIRLYQWMASYYQCDLGRVFRPLVSKTLTNSSEKKVVSYSLTGGGEGLLTARQQEALAVLRDHGTEFTNTELRERFGITPAIVAALCRKGYAQKRQKTVVREAFEFGFDVVPERVNLTDEQRHAVEVMGAALAAPEKPFLLHGITGSGKTHIYTELAQQTLDRGRSVIILVPEISLTPQTIMRFRAAVGDVVTVIHSHMSEGERRDSMQELVTGAKRLVIGVRSAILAPMDNVGLIVVDEEHDGSYKQTDSDPRYNARDVAVMRGHFQKALVVLGSATPSLESFYNAQNGKYRLLTLARRFGEACLPKVSIVDMNEEHRNNNWTILSRALESRMHECLAADRQIILLLNRRGYSAVLMCKECGYTHRCPNCSVPLRYHRSDIRLKCHLCTHDVAAPDQCPVCRGDQMKYKGTGIQKAEEYIRERFPAVRILRMDRDSTKTKGAHHVILDAFAKREADILLGTQMVAKGLNFPGVALVGVLQADTGLLVPDFRASERTFQLLTQVAGRAGRSDNVGDVVIQTYFPKEPAIVSASTHDYEGFSAAELGNRRELNYPPFGRLARILCTGPDDGLVKREIWAIAGEISTLGPSLGILGPAPAVLEKISNEYRYSLIIKSASQKVLGGVLAALRKRALPKKIRMMIDVDPVNML